MSEEDLPVLIVSAVDSAAANAVISGIIDGNEVKEVGERVWQLSNKYYTALVSVHVLLDGDPPLEASLLDRVEALVIHLTDEECEDTGVLERRSAAERGGGAELRLALCAAAPVLAAPPGLELVPPAAAAAPPPGPFPELRGCARLREALHAHVWPGLRPVAAPALVARENGEDDDEDVDEEEMERRAELLAGVLGALADARGGAGRGGRGQRLQRAEDLVRAVCGALGTHFHDL